MKIGDVIGTNEYMYICDTLTFISKHASSS